MAVSRRRSAPVAKTNYDSDEDQIEYLNYNESKYYGYVNDFPSLVQVQRPNPNARELKEHFVEYTEQTVQLMVPMLKFYFHDGVRATAAESLPCLIGKIKILL